MSVSQKIYLIVLTAVLLGAHVLIKQQYQEAVYNVSQQGSLGNDYSAVFRRLTAFFSLEGFVGTISAMAGQWFYFGAATFLMGYYGMFSSIKKCRTEFVKGNIERALLFLFIILSFVSTFMIGAVAMNTPGRVDQVMYGRYIEITFGFFIIMGWMDFLDREQRIRDYVIAVVPFVICGLICGWRIIQLDFAKDSIFQYVCSPAVAVEAGLHNNVLLALYIVIVTLLVFGFVVVTKYILDHKGAYSLYMSLMIIVLITNVLMGLCVNERVVLKTKHVFYDFSETLLNASEENGQDMNKWIVYPGNEGISAGTQIELACIQFRLKSNCLIMMSSDDKPGVENTDDNILMIPSAAKSAGEYDVIAETGSLALVKPVQQADRTTESELFSK